jgi:hypothetical protein
VDAQLEKIVNDAIFTARILAAGDAEPERTIPLYVYNFLGRDVAGTGIKPPFLAEVSCLTGIEVHLEQNLAVIPNGIVQKTFAQSRYRDNYVGLFSPFWSTANRRAANHSIAPNIRIRGQIMGTDKWGHFFQQGYWGFVLEDRFGFTESEIDIFHKYVEGHSSVGFVTDLMPKNLWGKCFDASRQLTDVPIWSYGYFGRRSTGVVSNADLRANMLGMSFYKDLSKDPWNFKFSTISFPRDKMYLLNEYRNGNEFDPRKKHDRQ